MSPVNLTTSTWQASQPNQQSAGQKICQTIAFTGDYILTDLSSQVNQNSQTRFPMYTISGSAISVGVFCLYIWRVFYYIALFRNSKSKKLWAASLTIKGSHWSKFTKRRKGSWIFWELWKRGAVEENLGPHTFMGPYFLVTRLTRVSKQRHVITILSQMK